MPDGIRDGAIDHRNGAGTDAEKSSVHSDDNGGRHGGRRGPGRRAGPGGVRRDRAGLSGVPLPGHHLPGGQPRAVPLQLARWLDERHQRAAVLQGHLPPVLPAQPARPGLGHHALGPRHQPRPGALDAAADRPGARRAPRQPVVRRRRGGHRQRHRPEGPGPRTRSSCSPAPTASRSFYSTDGGAAPSRPTTTAARSSTPPRHQPRPEGLLGRGVQAVGAWWSGPTRAATASTSTPRQPARLDLRQPLPAPDWLFECPDMFPLPVDGDTDKDQVGAHRRQRRVRGRQLRRHDVHHRLAAAAAHGPRRHGRRHLLRRPDLQRTCRTTGSSRWPGSAATPAPSGPAT